MEWMTQLNGDPLTWLLSEEHPGVRYLALRDLLDLEAGNPELVEAQARAHKEGPIALILDQMNPEGFWEKPGSGYSPKYRGSVWSIILLAQLGASAAQDYRIKSAGEYILENALTDHGQFSVSGTPSGTIDCLQGNLCAALTDLGIRDPRLRTAFEWMARTVTGEGIAPASDKKAPLRYYSGKCGPGFCCGANNQLPCAWGAVKVMLAFSKLSQSERTPLIKRAIQIGSQFLLGIDPSTAKYPQGWTSKPSRNWWKFGFPVFYITDLLQNVESLVRLGYGKDQRLKNALKTILQKQDQDGRWALEYDYSGKTWGSYGIKSQANKWVTYRALLVLKKAAEY